MPEGFRLPDHRVFVQDVTPRDGKLENPFEVWFSNGKLIVIVEGANYGHTAHVEIKKRWWGRRVTFNYIVMRDMPPEELDTFGEGGQLRLIRREAERLRRFGKRLLSGDMSEYRWMVAKDLEKEKEEAKNRRTPEEEMQLIRLRLVAEEAEAAFRQRDYKRVVELLSPLSAHLSDIQRKKLLYAQKHS